MKDNTVGVRLKGNRVAKLIGRGYQASKLDLNHNPDRKRLKHELSTKRFKIVPKYSNRNHTVYRDTKDGNRPIITFTGTNPRRLADLKSDLAIALGRESKDKRFQEAERFVKHITKKSGKNPTLVSHSLGGSLNEFAARNNENIRQINVNKGAGLGSFNRTRQRHQTDISVGGDPVSLLSFLNNNNKGHTYNVPGPSGSSFGLRPLTSHTFGSVGRTQIVGNKVVDTANHLF